MKTTLLALLAVGCGASLEEKPETRIVIKATMPAQASTAPIAPAAIQKIEPQKVETRVRFLTTTVLRKEPRADAAKVGVIRKDAVAVRASEATGDGCKDDRWIQIAPRGWACENGVEITSNELTAATPITLDAPEDSSPLVPGVYGVVRGAEVSTSVRVVGGTTIDGVRHVYTSSGITVPASSVAYFSPSKFRGVAVDKTLPAWIRSASDSRKPVTTFTAPRGKRNGELAPRTIVSILEESDDGKFVRVTGDQWIARRDVRVASLTEPPPGTGANEKWFDVDRDEQVLVAYEGKRPVYATMVSTGKWKHATPTVVARVGSKLLTASMNNNRGDEQYAVADVPWTMYYDNSYALHTSYWHDGFGGPRSHGCINLSPRDARALYQWSSPDIPAGWIAVYGDADNPGSLVRVHSREMPEPVFRGYAKMMRERGLVATTE
jgi:hypothetical protein